MNVQTDNPNTRARGPGAANRGADNLVLILLAASTLAASMLVIQAPRTVGLNQDDGIYLSTAKAIAEGRGYRHLHLPGEPFQTKYPIGYPLLLAAVWKAWPRFPENIVAVQILNAVLWGIGSWLAYLVLRRHWRLPPLLAGLAVLLPFAGFATLGLLQTAMSETLYFPLSIAALLAAGLPPRRQPATAVVRKALKRRNRQAQLGVGAVLLAGLAYLTRSIGVTAIGAVVLGLALNRRWRAALMSALIGLAPMVLWRGWTSYAARENATIPALDALRYDLDYTLWIPRDIDTAARVAANNVTEAALSYVLLFVPPPYDWCRDLLLSGPSQAAVVYCLILAVWIPVAVGAVVVWRRRYAIAHIYLLLYLAMVFVWPFSPGRFLMPVLPLLLGMTLAGIAALLTGTARTVGALFQSDDPAVGGSAGTARRSPVPNPGTGSNNAGRFSPFSRRVVLIIAIAAAIPNLRFLVAPPGRSAMEEGHRRREALITMLHAHTPPDAIVCSNYAGYLHLRTGRKFVPFAPYENPIPHLYPPDRKAAHCGMVRTEMAVAADAERLTEYLPAYMRKTGAGYLVAPPGFEPPARQFSRAAAADPYVLYVRVD